MNVAQYHSIWCNGECAMCVVCVVCQCNMFEYLYDTYEYKNAFQLLPIVRIYMHT